MQAALGADGVFRVHDRDDGDDEQTTTATPRRERRRESASIQEQFPALWDEKLKEGRKRGSRRGVKGTKGQYGGCGGCG
jgi:hypothetical protein